MTDGQRREEVEQRSKEIEKKHTEGWIQLVAFAAARGLGFWGFTWTWKGPRVLGEVLCFFPFQGVGRGRHPTSRPPTVDGWHPEAHARLYCENAAPPSPLMPRAAAWRWPGHTQDSFIFKTSPMKMRNNGGRVFIFQVQCDAHTCTIKKMGSMAYIVNQQAKRLEIRDDGRRPRTSYFVFSLQCVLILYDYIYDIISDPRFFHFQDKSNENEK